GVRFLPWLFLGVSASTRLVFRDVAQPGSAPEWGSGGRGFKSRRPDCARSVTSKGGRHDVELEVVKDARCSEHQKSETRHCASRLEATSRGVATHVFA